MKLEEDLENEKEEDEEDQKTTTTPNCPVVIFFPMVNADFKTYK